MASGLKSKWRNPNRHGHLNLRVLGGAADEVPKWWDIRSSNTMHSKDTSLPTYIRVLVEKALLDGPAEDFPVQVWCSGLCDRRDYSTLRGVHLVETPSVIEP
eukprot:m.378294 g.378294  ORF g.378294 m.378294 type:complete len:102 (+) comp20929_c0_seq2:1559-1864(+)